MHKERNCGRCGKGKPLSGVWYIVEGPASGTEFVCEACYVAELAAVAA